MLLTKHVLAECINNTTIADLKDFAKYVANQLNGNDRMASNILEVCCKWAKHNTCNNYMSCQEPPLPTSVCYHCGRLRHEHKSRKAGH